MANFTNNSAGGKAVKKKYGREHLVQLGKRGFEATTQLYFGGDRQAHLRWLQRKGLYTVDKDVSYGQIYADPGPHPAHQVVTPEQQEFLDMREWLRSVEAGMAQD